MHLINALKGSTILLGVLFLFTLLMSGISIFQITNNKKALQRNTDQEALRKDIEIGLAVLESWKSKILWVIIAASLFSLVILLSWFLFYNNDYSILSKSWGEVGSYFGGLLTPFFSFITIIMLLSTLIQQQKGLLLSYRELEANRIESEGQKKAMQIQSNSFLIQNFENRLFSLLNNTISSYKNLESFPTVYNHHVAGKPSPSRSKEIVHGDLATSSILLSIILEKDFSIGQEIIAAQGPYTSNKHELSVDIYKSIHNYIEQTNIGNVIRQLSVITAFINETFSKNVEPFTPKKRKEYFDIIATNISINLMIYFYIHSCFDRATNNSIKETNLFRYLPEFIEVSTSDIRPIDLKPLSHLVPQETLTGNMPFVSYCKNVPSQGSL